MPAHGQTLRAEYEVVTPAMVGGANHAPEFRLVTYIDMVRWWWRFLALGRYGNFKIASFWEGVVFGWNAAPFGRKRVSFRLPLGIEDGVPRPWEANPEWNKWSGINYLTAQGFNEAGGRTPAPVKSFTVEARLFASSESNSFDRTPFCDWLKKQKSHEQDFTRARLDQWKDESRTSQILLEDAIVLIGLLGGIGARSRRGFGSLAIRTFSGGQTEAIEAPAKTVEAYKALLTKRLGDKEHFFSGLPDHTALSSGTKIQICARGKNARELMNDIGWAFQIYRSWGQRNERDDPSKGHKHELFAGNGLVAKMDAGKIKSSPAKDAFYEAQVQSDHDVFYVSKFVNGTDNRAVFGLPHNYGKVQVGWTKDGHDTDFRRRASPLMFHFHRLAGDETLFVSLLAPAKFVPDNAQLHVSKGAPYRKSVPSDFALAAQFAEFVHTPTGAATGGKGGGVKYTTYNVINPTDGAVL